MLGRCTIVSYPTLLETSKLILLNSCRSVTVDAFPTAFTHWTQFWGPVCVVCDQYGVVPLLLLFLEVEDAEGTEEGAVISRPCCFS